MEVELFAILKAEAALTEIAALRDIDLNVDFESIWTFLNQYRQMCLDNLTQDQDIALELARTPGFQAWHADDHLLQPKGSQRVSSEEFEATKVTNLNRDSKEI